jgi:hypothetical protein
MTGGDVDIFGADDECANGMHAGRGPDGLRDS